MTPPAATTSPRPPPQYRLDDLTIDVGKAEVRRGDELLALPRLSFDVLLALVKAAPNLLTVDDLMAQVWPGVVINAETVSQRIKLLRAALGDDPKQPRYIAVSRGRGYRVIGEVTMPAANEFASAQPATPPAASPADTSPTPPPPSSALAKLPRWIWLAVGAVLLAAALTFLVDRRQDAATVSLPARSVAVLPFDNLGQSPQDAALAFGVAETLLHRLSASKDLTVIARQSSFSIAPRSADVRDIGRRLNARYIVEGSLQSTPDRLRITAQLIDASTGGHVWSLQFDRKPQDIFVIQDEIAARVTDAMRLTLTDPTPAADRGTQDFDAYLAHAQGRARLATGRVADAKLAIGDFERAMRIDPTYARAYAGLAEARYFVADSEMTPDRAKNIERVTADNRQLLERALAIDDQDPDTHLQLADLTWDGDRADQELERALQLNPNSAPAYRLLSQLRMFRDHRPDEAMIAIDKARLLSPLEVRYDNDKALLALYGKSDARLAEQLWLSVLERDPASTTALWRLGELYWCCRAEAARGIRYLEQALQRDPDNEFGRRILMRAYLDLGDAKEAAAIAATAPHAVGARQVLVLAYAHDWPAAAEAIYREERMGTGQAIDLSVRSYVLRLQARATHDYARARDYLADRALVTWDAAGQPTLPSTWVPDAAVGVADMLLQAGEREKAQRLMAVIFESIDREIRRSGRGEFWYLRALPLLHALQGDDELALTYLEKCFDQLHMPLMPLYLDTEPAYQPLRAQPRFRALLERSARHFAAQRRELDALRSKALVPYRSRA